MNNSNARRFKIGDTITWKSHSGSTRNKYKGRIRGFIPSGSSADDMMFKKFSKKRLNELTATFREDNSFFDRYMIEVDDRVLFPAKGTIDNRARPA